MITDHDRQWLAEAFQPLCAPLHEAFDKGVDTAYGYFDNFPAADPDAVTPVRSHLARFHSAEVLRELEGNEELGDWTVLAPRPNAALWLRRDLLRVRMLHDGPGGTVPPPGSNSARIRYYENEQLALFGAQASELLGLWSVDPVTREVSIRIVRPRGRWKFGRRERVDLDFLLPRADVELYGMEWWPAEEDLELPLPADDSQEDGDAGGDSG